METRELPQNTKHWNWTTTPRIYAALGVKCSTIPKDMEGTFTVDGFTIVVIKQPVPGRRKARIYLNHNGRLIPVGRVRQAKLEQ